MNKKELNQLEEKTTIMFNKFGFKTPKRVLPNIIFDWMTPEYCFKVRMRTLISEMKTNKNFEILTDGTIITNTNSKPIIVIDNSISKEITTREVKTNDLIKEIKDYLKKEGLNLDTI